MARLGFHTRRRSSARSRRCGTRIRTARASAIHKWVHDPVAHLVDPAYAAAIRRATPTDRATPSAALVPLAAASAVRQAQDAGPHEKQETTHYSIIDRNGEAVSVTYTLNGWFGAQVMAPDTGVMLNDEMDDFASKAGAATMYGPGRQRSQCGGTRQDAAVLDVADHPPRNGHVVMVIGSPGGSRIPTITLSAILGVVDYHRTIQQAIGRRPDPRTVASGAGRGRAGCAARRHHRGAEHEGYVLQPHAPWGSAQGILVGGPALGAGPVDGNLVYAASTAGIPARQRSASSAAARGGSFRMVHQVTQPRNIAQQRHIAQHLAAPLDDQLDGDGQHDQQADPGDPAVALQQARHQRGGRPIRSHRNRESGHQDPGMLLGGPGHRQHVVQAHREVGPGRS